MARTIPTPAPLPTRPPTRTPMPTPPTRTRTATATLPPLPTSVATPFSADYPPGFMIGECEAALVMSGPGC